MTLDDITNPTALERITTPSDGRELPADAVTTGAIVQLYRLITTATAATVEVEACTCERNETRWEANPTGHAVGCPCFGTLTPNRHSIEATPINALAPFRALGQWFTPPWLATEIANLINVRDRSVLEPSAGDGAIVEALIAAGARDVMAVELDPAMCTKLRDRFAGRPVRVIEGDFLTVEIDPASFDCIVGNPPYDKGADSLHLARIADLIEAHERVVSFDVCEAALLLRTVVLHGGKRYERVWSRLAVRSLRACADRIPFLAAGGEPAEAGKIDVSVFRVGARVPGEREPIEWVREPNRGAR